MHSDALTPTERIRWKDKDTISCLLTIHDPKSFTWPWSQEFQIKAKPEWDQVACLNTSARKTTAAPAASARGTKFSPYR